MFGFSWIFPFLSGLWGIKDLGFIFECHVASSADSLTQAGGKACSLFTLHFLDINVFSAGLARAGTGTSGF